MKILLVNPKPLKNRNFIVVPPINLGYLATALIQSGHEVEILDCVLKKYSLEQFIQHIELTAYDAVGFSMFTASIGAVRQYSKEIKNINQDIITIVGGVHAILKPEESLSSLRKVDFLFRGEAEEGICQLLDIVKDKIPIRRAENLHDVDNLVWRNDKGGIVCNPRTFIKDLGTLGYPAWSLINPNDYKLVPMGVFTKKRKVAPMITTRGCQFPCTFCSVGLISGKRVRERPVSVIINEIKYLIETYQIAEIHIVDDNFTSNQNFVKSFCETLIEENINIYWACPNGIRLDTLDESLLRLMEESGCYSFAVGIEFGTQKMLNVTRKVLTLAHIEERVELIKATTKIRITGFFIIGHPEENIRDINKTIEFACKLDLDRASFSNFYPFPETEDYKKLNNKGEHFDQEYDSIYIHNITYTPKNISVKMLSRLRNKAFCKFYFRPRILMGILQELQSFSQIKLLFNRIMVLQFIPSKFR